MKGLTFLLGFIFILSGSVKAQISGDISVDSVKSMLCHKWGYRAAILGGQEIKNLDENVTYQFYRDNTLDRVSSKGKAEKGTWIYEPHKKTITIKVKKAVLYVTKLEPGDLVVSRSQLGAGVEGQGVSLGSSVALKLIGD